MSKWPGFRKRGCGAEARGVFPRNFGWETAKSVRHPKRSVKGDRAGREPCSSVGSAFSARVRPSFEATQQPDTRWSSWPPNHRIAPRQRDRRSRGRPARSKDVRELAAIPAVCGRRRRKETERAHNGIARPDCFVPNTPNTSQAPRPIPQWTGPARDLRSTEYGDGRRVLPEPGRSEKTPAIQTRPEP